MNKLLTCLIALICSSTIFAQQAYWDMMNDPNANLNDIITRAEAHFDAMGRGKGIGMKPFYRWLNDNRHNFDEQGNRIKKDNPYLQLQKFKKAKGAQKLAAATTDFQWHELGMRSFERNVSVNNLFNFGPGNGRITGIAYDNVNNIIYITSPGGGLWSSANSGASWEPVDDQLASLELMTVAVDPNNTNTIYVGGNFNRLFKSTNAGADWTALDLGVEPQFSEYSIKKVVVRPSNSNEVFVTSTEGLFRSTNGGASFQRIVDERNFEDVKFKADNDNIAFASSDSIWRSTDGGANWTSVSDGVVASDRTMLAVTPANPDIVYAIQANSSDGLGFLYKSTDAGLSFDVVVTGDPANSTNYLSGSFRSNQAGGQAHYDMAIAVSPSDADDVWIGGVYAHHSTDGGLTFPERAIELTENRDVHNDHHAMEYINGEFFNGNDGGIYKYDPAQEGFIDLSANLGITQFYRMASSEVDPYIIVGGSQDNGSWRKLGDNNPENWKKVGPGDGMEALVHPTNPMTIYFTSQHFQRMYVSHDGGNSADIITRPSGDSWTWTPVFTINPIDGSKIYVGAGNVYESSDNGASWQKLTDHSGVINDIEICRANTDVIYYTNGAGIYASTNGGADFAEVDPTNTISRGTQEVASSPFNASVIAVSTNDDVYMSFDGGLTFNNITANLPDLHIYDVALDGTANNGVYVATEIGIYYTNDDLAGWETFGLGLPNVAVRELDVNYGAQLLRAATYGRGIWEVPLFTPANVDDDNDGFTADVDCNDDDETINPEANDVAGDGIDANCDGFDGNNPQQAFNGTPQTIPGIVEAEFYDEGGAGIAYFDTDAGNNGNAIRNDDVDVEFGSSNGNVGWIFDGEWLKYTVVVETDGLYTVNASVASINSGTSFNLMLDEQELTGAIDVPNTGNWQIYQTVSVSDLNLTAGTHELRFNATANGFNVDEFEFVLDQDLTDNDKDGYFAFEDCDDENNEVHPLAYELLNNGIDDNCNGEAINFDYTISTETPCVNEAFFLDLTESSTPEFYQSFNWIVSWDGGSVWLGYEGEAREVIVPVEGEIIISSSLSIPNQDSPIIPARTMMVSACDDNQPPVVAAGDFKQITLPTNSVTVDDAVAFDNDGTIASLQWTQDAGPNTATISGATTIEPTFSGLVEGLYDFRLTGTDDDGASSFGLVSVRVNPAENQAPIIAAGDFKQITLPTNSVTVNDAVARDNDGTIASLLWTQDAGPNTATISGATTIEPTFSGLVEGLYDFRLTGTDDDGASSFGLVSVRVNPAENQAPIIAAGDFKQITLPTNSVTVNDAVARDNDGTIASLLWSQDSGPNTATISNGTTIEPTFSGLVEGLYEFRLTGTDDDGASSFGTVSVRVNPAENQAPIIAAGDFKQITLPTNSVTVNDAVARDNDGTIASLLWSQDSGPNTATISNGTTIEPTFSGLVEGLYEFRLTGTDDDGASSFGTVSVRVNPAENQAPVVGAGDFKQITLPTDFLAIDDAVAFDNDGTIVSLQWTQDSGPNTATIGNATTIEPTISGLVAGLYEFRLTATDDDGATNFGTVSVRVHPAASNQTPFNGTAQVIPGTVEAEFYDEGGANEAYFDTDAGNNGNFLRSDDVDVEVGSSNGNVGWIFDGEWLEYTVDVQTTGSYSVAVSVASINSGTSFNLELDGNSLTGTINVPNTGNWQSYQTVTAEGLQMTAGTHILRFNALANGFNVDDYVFTLEAGPVDNDNDGFTADVDCDDNNPAINPGATEVCDGVDNDCDGQIDEGVLTLFYFDRDQDQFGSQTEDPIAACVSPEPAFLYETNNDDCDDTRDVDFPGAPENCDQRDNDCDGQVDEGIATSQFFADDDNDGFGDPSRPVQSCGFFVGISSNDEDCNDENSAVNPNAAEICDGIDNDCDGEIDEDGDLITWYRDQDNDTYGNPDITIESCTQPDGYVDRAGDCDDTRDNMNPDEQELCDQIDNNCNGVNNEGLLIMQYQDVDGDGFGTPDSSLSACAVISGFVLNDEDCDDNNGAVNPDATEICDEIDNDCDGEIDEGVQTQFFADSDRDGWGANNTWVWACSNPGNVPEAFVLISGDCNDSHSGINPGVDEIPGNGFDDNCDGEIDEEAGCEVEAANGEYTLSISENGNQLVVDWDGLAGMGNGFVFMDQWVDGNYRGSFSASIDFGQRIFGLDNIAQGSTVEFFFKYDRPGGQYIGARTDHSYTMGECAGVAKKAVTTEAVSFSLLPNPAFDEITIEAQGADILKATIIGNRGVVNSPVIGSGNTMKVDVSDLATGIYTVQIETISGIEFVRFVKQ